MLRQNPKYLFPVFISLFFIASSAPTDVGQKPTLISAITRDYNGNGFLDAIELNYSMGFSIPDNYNNQAKLIYIIVEKNATDNIYLKVDSLKPVPLSDDKKFLLYFDEWLSEQENVPQTAWSPLLTIDYEFDTDSILTPVDRFACRDGAAPVVWSVVHDLTRDVVRVTMSEDFNSPNGSQFLSSAPQPQAVFNIYSINSVIDTVLVDSILAGVTEFIEQSDNWITFTMTNGQVLQEEYLFNINSDNEYIADINGNLPLSSNQTKRVFVSGTSNYQKPHDCGECGTGVELAFCPAIGVQLLSLLRKRKKKKKYRRAAQTRSL